jgi:hypothetical protein
MSTRNSAPHRAPARAAVAALLGALLLPALAPAQDRPPQLYQVEMVVFLQPAGISAERPPLPEAPEADAASSVLLPAPDLEETAQDAAERAAEDTLPPEFSAPRLDRTLDAAARALSRRGYEVVWHQAWVQPPAQRRGTDLALLAALGQGPAAASLSGSISLSAGRFLHLGVALEWETDGTLTAQMDQRRRIRPEVEQYFDHPRLGALAVIRPVD